MAFFLLAVGCYGGKHGKRGCARKGGKHPSGYLDPVPQLPARPAHQAATCARDGRKLVAGSALLDRGGAVLATARTVWITVPRAAHQQTAGATS